MTGMARSISQAAALSGVSTRVLRHYDEIGLLQPSARTAAGYRQYDDEDLLRLQRIIAYRGLGLGLDDIRRLLEADPVDAAVQLETQEALLESTLERVREQLQYVRTTRRARKMGLNLTPDELREAFGDHDPTQYQAEAEERWGHTDAYRESTRRAAQYSREDWARHAAESEAIEAGLADCLRRGLTPGSDEAKAWAERHRLLIDTWFYPCSHEMQTGLAEMYVADPRFTEHYDRRQPGLAAYVRDAIIANALDHL